MAEMPTWDTMQRAAAARRRNVESSFGQNSLEESSCFKKMSSVYVFFR